MSSCQFCPPPPLPPPIPMSCQKVGLVIFVHFESHLKMSEKSRVVRSPPPTHTHPKRNLTPAIFIHFGSSWKKIMWFPLSQAVTFNSAHHCPASWLSVCWVLSAGDLRSERLIFYLQVLCGLNCSRTIQTSLASSSFAEARLTSESVHEPIGEHVSKQRTDMVCRWRALCICNMLCKGHWIEKLLQAHINLGSFLPAVCTFWESFVVAIACAWLTRDASIFVSVVSCRAWFQTTSGNLLKDSVLFWVDRSAHAFVLVNNNKAFYDSLVLSCILFSCASAKIIVVCLYRLLLFGMRNSTAMSVGIPTFSEKFKIANVWRDCRMRLWVSFWSYRYFLLHA